MDVRSQQVDTVFSCTCFTATIFNSKTKAYQMKSAGILYERHLSQLIQRRKKTQHKIKMKNKYFIFHPKKEREEVYPHI